MRQSYTSTEACGWSFLHNNNIRLPASWSCNAGVLAWYMYCLDGFWGGFGNKCCRTCGASMRWRGGRAWSWWAIYCHYSRRRTCEKERILVNMSSTLINMKTEQFPEQSTILLLGNMVRKLPKKIIHNMWLRQGWWQASSNSIKNEDAEYMNTVAHQG